MAPTERVHWDSDGIEVNPWLAKRVRIGWSSLLAIRVHKGATLFLYERDGRRKQIGHAMKPERHQRLLEAHWEHQVAALERDGEHRVRSCSTTGGLPMLVVSGLLFVLLLGGSVCAAFSGEPIEGGLIACFALLFAVLGIWLVASFDGYVHQRRWHRAVFHRRGIARTDVNGEVAETPWHRVRIEGGRVRVDDASLRPSELSGAPLTDILVRSKGTPVPVPPSLGAWPLFMALPLTAGLLWLAWSPSLAAGLVVAGSVLVAGIGLLFAMWIRSAVARELPRWTARWEDLARRCDWIDRRAGAS